MFPRAWNQLSDPRDLSRFPGGGDPRHFPASYQFASRHDLQGLATQETEDGKRVIVAADVYAVERNDRIMEEVVSRIGIEPGVTAVSWERNPA